MIRTQIYLPEEVHLSLLTLAKKQGSTLSKLIRTGAIHVLKNHYGETNPAQKSLRFFSDPSSQYKITLSKPAVELVREERE